MNYLNDKKSLIDSNELIRDLKHPLNRGYDMSEKIVWYKNWMVLGLVGLLVAGITFGGNQYMENKKYERYLSQRLTNEISIFSSLTGLNYLVLDHVIEEGKINKEQYDSLKEHFFQIHTNGNDFVELASHWLNKVDSPKGVVHPYPVFMAGDFGRELSRNENRKFNEKDELILNEEQIKKMKFMRDICKVWINVIADNMKGIRVPKKEALSGNGLGFTGEAVTSDAYFDTYFKRIVESDDWIEMVKELQHETLKYEMEYKLLFE